MKINYRNCTPQVNCLIVNMAKKAQKAAKNLKRKHNLNYGVILRNRRKELKMTQKELAEKVGTARSYIARIEKGETDIQLSSFLRISKVLRIEFSPVYI